MISPVYVIIITLIVVLMVIRGAIAVAKHNATETDVKKKHKLDWRLPLALLVCCVLAWLTPQVNLGLYVVSLVVFGAAGAIGLWSIGECERNVPLALMGSATFTAVLFIGLIMLSSSLRFGGLTLGLLWLALSCLIGLILGFMCLWRGNRAAAP